MSEFPKFRKTALVEAEQFTEGPGIRLPFVVGTKRGPMYCRNGEWFVDTLEGPLRVRSGDWILRGKEGEFWPVKGDIFAATYEPAQ